MKHDPFFIQAVKALGYKSIDEVPTNDDGEIDQPVEDLYPRIFADDKRNPKYAKVLWKWDFKFIKYEWEDDFKDGEVSTLTVPKVFYPENILVSMTGKCLKEIIDIPGAERATIIEAVLSKEFIWNTEYDLRVLLKVEKC
jgi:hypothetical protein